MFGSLCWVVTSLPSPLILHSWSKVCFDNFWKKHLDFLFQDKINFEICWSCVYILVFKRALFRGWKICERWSETWVWEFRNKKFYLTKTKKTRREKLKSTKAIFLITADNELKKKVSYSPTLGWDVVYLCQALSSTAITDLFPEEHLWRSFHVLLWQCI